MLGAVIYSVVFICLESVGSLDVPVITRSTYDLIQFPNCGGHENSDDFNCNDVMEYGIRTGDQRTCTCRCKDGYFAYRQPYVTYDGQYYYNVDRKGCVWYGTYREGCHALHNIDHVTFRGADYARPIIIDLTQPGNLTLQSEHYTFDCLHIVPYVRVPAENQWKQITDFTFHLENLNRAVGPKRFYQLQWHSNSSDMYAYQGLIMRLDLHQCFSSPIVPPQCIMTKISGTYTGANHCRRRTIDGRCCVFPFVHKGTLYNDCMSTDDMTAPWCPVTLSTDIKGIRNWRKECADTPSTPPFRPTTVVPAVISFGTSPTTSLTSITPSLETSKMTINPELPTNQSRHSRAKPFPTFVTVTVAPCKDPDSPKGVSPEAGSTSGESGLDVGVIIAIVFALVLILLAALILGVFLRRRKIAGKNLSGRKTVSSEVLTEEGPYATIQPGTPPHTRKLTNHGFQESMEMTPRRTPRVIRGYINTDAGQSSPWPTRTEEGKPPALPAYNMPASDYSLIVTPTQHSMKTNSNRPLPPLEGPSKHVYSVLERDNDPLKFPQPTDNDRVFVEFNPLYGTLDFRNEPDEYEPENNGAIYEDPSEFTSNKRISDIPEIPEQDV